MYYEMIMHIHVNGTTLPYDDSLPSIHRLAWNPLSVIADNEEVILRAEYQCLDFTAYRP